jgi:hypothetical protein
MSIWTEPSKYGTCSPETKPVSISTVRRWMKKDNRTKTRKSQSYHRQEQKLLTA